MKCPAQIALAGAAASSRRQPAVDDEFGPGYEKRFVGQEVDDEVGDLGWGAEPAERNTARHARSRRVRMTGLGRDALDQRALQKGRVHRVAAHLRIDSRAM